MSRRFGGASQRTAVGAICILVVLCSLALLLTGGGGEEAFLVDGVGERDMKALLDSSSLKLDEPSPDQAAEITQERAAEAAFPGVKVLDARLGVLTESDTAASRLVWVISFEPQSAPVSAGPPDFEAEPRTTAFIAFVDAQSGEFIQGAATGTIR